MKEMMKNTGILLVITLIAGLLLGLVLSGDESPHCRAGSEGETGGVSGSVCGCGVL